jgi:hypothetical protein
MEYRNKLQTYNIIDGISDYAKKLHCHFETLEEGCIAKRLLNFVCVDVRMLEER